MRPLISTFLALSLAVALYAEDPETKGRKEFEQVIGAIETGLPTWTKFDASDYTLFYSAGSPPHSGAAGLYLSSAPFPSGSHDLTKEVAGRIGALEVKWTKQTIADGSMQQEAVVALRPHLFAHVLIESRSEADLALFISELGRLPVFSPKQAANAAPYAGPGIFDPHLRSQSTTQANAARQ